MRKPTDRMVGLGLVAGGLLLGSAWSRRRRRVDFRDWVVVISGGSRGLGLALARQFVHDGAKVAILGRDERRLERARAELENASHSVRALRCDVRNRLEVADAVAAIESELGPVDVLVNNAGVIQVGPLETMTTLDFEEAMAVHFWGPLYLTAAVLPSMKRRRRGRIINISSIGGKVSMPHMLPYGASKFALTALSDGLRAELTKYGIRVLTVCPGTMRTGSPRNALFKGKYEKEYGWFSASAYAPLVSMSAERAARRIVAAARDGDSELILGIPAKLASLVHGLSPGLTANLLSVIDQFVLPSPNEEPDATGHLGKEREEAKPSSSRIRRTEERYNQLD